MNIIELKKNEELMLQPFKNKEYPIVDREHYGDIQLDFEGKEFIFVIKDKENIAGFIKIKIRSNIAYIDSLLVGQDFRGKGIGKKLVIAAENKAKELNTHKICLETGMDWKARFFYEKLGYKVRTILPNDIAHQDCVLMDKML